MATSDAREQAAPRWRLLLADADPDVRSALRLLLDRKRDLLVVGEATDALGLLAAAVSTQPDLVVAAWELPGLHPALVLAALRGRCPAVRAVVLSTQPERRREALQAGAAAFASKADAPDRLLAALRAVLADSGWPYPAASGLRLWGT